MSERLIADAFDRWLREQGLVFRRDRMDRATTCIRGWPDFEIIRNGRVFLLELKDEKGRLSRDQINLHKRLADQGTTVHVCRTIEAACLLVTEWLNQLSALPTVRAADNGLRRFGGAIVQTHAGGREATFVRVAGPNDAHIPMLTK